MLWPNVQAKAARARTEPENEHDARGARSLLSQRLGFSSSQRFELSKLSPELVQGIRCNAPYCHWSQKRTSSKKVFPLRKNESLGIVPLAIARLITDLLLGYSTAPMVIAYQPFCERKIFV